MAQHTTATGLLVEVEERLRDVQAEVAAYQDAIAGRQGSGGATELALARLGGVSAGHPTLVWGSQMGMHAAQLAGLTCGTSSMQDVRAELTACQTAIACR